MLQFHDRAAQRRIYRSTPRLAAWEETPLAVHLEHLALFAAVCTFWGIILFVALTAALR